MTMRHETCDTASHLSEEPDREDVRKVYNGSIYQVRGLDVVTAYSFYFIVKSQRFLFVLAAQHFNFQHFICGYKTLHHLHDLLLTDHIIIIL